MEGARRDGGPRGLEGTPHEKLRRLLASVSAMTPLETRDRAIVAVANSTGLCAAKVAALDVADVAREGGALVLDGACDGSRAIRLDSAASEALGVYLVRGRSALSIDGDDAALFLSRFGRRLPEHRVARCLHLSKWRMGFTGSRPQTRA